MSTSLKIYFVFGGPGAGKGTLCTKLAKDLDLEHICVGDLIRAELKQSDDDMYTAEEKLQLQQAMQDGKLGNVWLIRKILDRALLARKSDSVLLDGFPRSLRQLWMFNNNVGDAECGILFACNPRTMERRVLKRSKDSNRIDDNLETLQKRFWQFHKDTMLCIDHLRKENKLLEIDVNDDLDEIYEGVKSKVLDLLTKGRNRSENEIDVL